MRALKAKPEGRRLLDPILVMAIGKDFWCIDGHHRLLAYARAGVDGPVPVEHFDGTIEDAIREAVRRNAKDRLAMTHADKLEAAWKLVVLAAHLKREVAEATGTAASSIATMRATIKKLEERGQSTVGLSWRDAKRALKGDEHKTFTDEMREAQVREWAKRLGRAFGGSTQAQVDVFADALELYSEKLPHKLVACWVDIAREMIEERRASGELST